jgi:hypothetical protein
MTNPTTYFGWQMPTATDLVTDLPADFEVFGQAVDTDFQDLLGGTTGQILSKTSATDLDFTWINNDQGDITAVTAGTGISGGGTSGAVTITNSMATEITAKADLIVGTGNASFDNLAVGTNGQVLTADSTVSPTGLKWATPSSGSLTLISTTIFTTVAGVSVDSLFSSTYDNYVVYFNISAVGAGSTDITMKLRSGGADNSTADYTSQTSYMQNGTLFTTYATASTGGFKVVQNIAAGSSATIQLYSPNLTTTKSGQILGQGTAEASNRMAFGSYYKPSATQFTGMSFISGINITGTLSVYGLAK